MKADELDAADAYCRRLAGRHYENFAVAAWFLPAPIRRDLARLYAYCRTTDDLGDESPDAIARLEAWQQQLLACFDSGAPDPLHPVLLAVRRMIESRNLPSAPFVDLIGANLQDQTVHQYEDWPALRDYCRLSAAPVGRLVLRIWDIADERADALSDDVCIGLQLANFAQDVAVDRAKGRTYLLQSDVREAGINGATERMCGRAARLLASGRELEPMVPLRLRIQLSLYRLGGLAILDAIRRIGYRTDVERPHVSTATKLRLVPAAAAEAAHLQVVAA
ncbi:MAG TPA: squalene/phytoene synthase family protein [Chloroflexota bacterium]|nr:squalene/phytoene synthase family protein [Chloroflexota bacterium]